MTTAIYVRISRDAEGTALGVERQLQDCQKLCEGRSWAFRVYEDNDVSAYSGKPRPKYSEMMGDVSAGKIKRIVAWHPDRLHRSPKELEAFIDVVEASKCEVVTFTAGDLDLSTPEGRLTARITGAVARKESEDKSRRSLRKHQELRETGGFSGGSVFGYEDGMIVVPEHAVLIRNAARDILEGKSLKGIAADWNEKKIPLRRNGKEWLSNHIKQVLTNPSVAGLRKNGDSFSPAKWEAILDQDTWTQVRAFLSAPSRRNGNGPVTRKHYLTGILKCGKCGKMLSSAKNSGIVS